MGTFADTLADLHQMTSFFDGATMRQFELGAWWLAYHGREAVAFAGVVPSTHARSEGYFSRLGVLQRHLGPGPSVQADAHNQGEGTACGVGQ
ncbi:hypothetical protein [Bradyrhizobium sp. CB2312]|uniref:hypothetical protein n=1 Tax=Bradyrhizobium sp. CB2312 TaxID=3039155 RepID=UPI0032C2272B